MQSTPQQLYLDLMKKSLAFALWPEPPAPIATYAYLRATPVRWVATAVSNVLARRGILLVKDPPFTLAERMEGHGWPGLADTMIGMKRLDNLHECVESVIADDVPGDLIETGVWRGGACILMRAVLAAHGVGDRRVFVADSFAGLPAPDAERHPADAGDEHHRHEPLAVSLEQVQANFQKYGLLDDQVVFLKGWFSDTLPAAPIERLAVLRLDGDMYGSTMDALSSLYPRLSPGGYCVVDDHALPGCAQAVADYRAQHGIVEPIQEVDWTGVFWRKARP